MADITRAVLVRVHDNGAWEQVVGVISRPTGEMSSNANLMQTLNDILEGCDFPLEMFPTGNYRLLVVSSKGLLRQRRAGFMIVQPSFWADLV
jgi:hypothetical protein